MKPKPLPSEAELDAAFKAIGDWHLHYYQLLYFQNPKLTQPGKGYPFNVAYVPDRHYLMVEHSNREFNFAITRGMTDSEVLEKCKLILANVTKKKISPHACCPLAEHRGCVCYESFHCPIHGDKCIGTHD